MAGPRSQTQRRRRSPSAPLLVGAWPRPALIATAISALLATALLANIFVLQSYERLLAQQGNAFVTEPGGASRSLRFTTPQDNYEEWTIKGHHRHVDNPRSPPGLKIAWLMSFPNSGTSFTSRLVRDATKTDSASNYADETPSGEAGLRLPVYEDQPDGPFWIKPEASPEFTEPKEYILTKVGITHIIISGCCDFASVSCVEVCSFNREVCC